MSVDIPNYRIIEKLGEGAQSNLYRARSMRNGKDYTVKIVKVTKPEDTSFIDLMRSEHTIGSAIDHPVIRKVYELRILRQRLRLRGAILFMEYVDGMAMSHKDFGRPLDEILRLFAVAAQGLHAMHRAGYVHADLKPNNILVSTDGQVKLIDLGQSSRIHEAKARVQGTIDYIAPEQVQRGILDQRTDVFGLGAALHRVVTGKPVATEMNQTVTVHSQSLVGKRVSQVRQDATCALPTCVARLIDDCCQYKPAARLPDMPALIERIRLARTILAKQAIGSADLDDAFAEEDFDPDEDPRSDSAVEAFGLSDEADDSVDLEDFAPRN
jgi:serine/threonine-protein kinase